MFRWLALATFLTTLGVSSWRRWRARRAGETIARSAEPPLLIAGRLLVALPLFGGIVAYLAHPAWMAWASLPLPAAARWIGVALGGATVPAAHWVLTTLGANVSETVLTKRGQQLVTTGPYRWVRHPLYTTGITLFLGLGLTAANWFILLWTAVALAAVRLVIVPREEAQLVLRFGDDYRRYRERTGALVPRWPVAR